MLKGMFDYSLYWSSLMISIDNSTRLRLRIYYYLSRLVVAYQPHFKIAAPHDNPAPNPAQAITSPFFNLTTSDGLTKPVGY